MKWLIILSVIVVIAVFIVNRYRRQIQMAMYVFRMFRKMRKINNVEEKQINTRADSIDSTLVNCAKCGTWIQRNKALKLRSEVYYCSSDCLETMTKIA